MQICVYRRLPFCHVQMPPVTPMSCLPPWSFELRPLNNGWTSQIWSVSIGLGQAAPWSSSLYLGPSLVVRDCYQDFSVNAFFVHAVAIGLQSSLSSQVQWLTDVLFKLFLLGSFKVFLGHVKQLSSSSLHYFNCCLVKFSFKENRFLGG